MAQMPMAPKAKKPGKKVNTARMAQAMRKPKAPQGSPMDPGSDMDGGDEANAMRRGGYLPGHGIGSG